MGEAKRKNQQMEAFMVWAFGDDYHALVGPDLAVRWNSRHSDVFTVSGEEDPREVMPKMLDAYMGGAS